MLAAEPVDLVLGWENKETRIQKVYSSIFLHSEAHYMSI